MKKLNDERKTAKGFTLIEVLLAIIIIAGSAIVVLMWLKISWSQTSRTNRLMTVCHVIEKQIEKQRMVIAQNPTTNYAAFILNNSIIILDSSVTPVVRVQWTIYAPESLKDPLGNNVNNVRKVLITAGYGSGKSDTLRVITAISKNF